MRHLALLLICCALAAADPAKVEPTTLDRIQAFADPATGKLERLEIYDTNAVTDSAGNTYKAPLRVTVVARSEAPALFTALDALVAKTTERDAAHRARKAAEEAARAEAAARAAQPAPPAR